MLSKKKKHSRKKSRRGKGAPAIWVILSLALVGMAVYAGIYLEKNTIIQDVHFSGNEFTDEQALFDAIESPVGIPADSIDFSGLFADIYSLPYVNHVSVHMNHRGTLTFQIKERQPIAMLVDGSDQIYVGEGGIKLPVMPEHVRDVPLLYGFPVDPVSDTLNSDAFKQVEQFLMEAKSSDIGWITISEVTWNNREGVVALTYENGVKLIFGKDDFNEKLINWEAFYTHVVARKGIRSFTSIDLRFRDQIVTQHL